MIRMYRVLGREDEYGAATPEGITIDGVPVSNEEWNAALAEWGDTASSQEKYVLTPYNEAEKMRTLTLTNDTIKKLQK